MNIKYDNTQAQLEGYIDPDLFKTLYDLCSFRKKDYFNSPTYQSGRWDGYTRLLSKITHKFRVGLLPRIIKFLDLHQVSYDLEYQGVLSEREFNLETIPTKIKPWPHQISTVGDAIQQKHCVIQIPTGGGKTIVMGMLIHELGRKTTIIVNELILLWQIAEELEDYLGMPVGRISGEIYQPEEYINVVSAQTLDLALELVDVLAGKTRWKKDSKGKKKKKTMADYSEPELKLDIAKLAEDSGCLIIDECHILPAGYVYDITDRFCNADYVFSFSATPYRTDGSTLKIEAAGGPTITQVSVAELVQAGFLLKPDIRYIKVNTKETGKYDLLVKKVVTDNEKYAQHLADLAQQHADRDQLILISVNRIAHGKLILGSQWHDRDDVRFVHGNSKNREQHFKDFKAKEFHILISTLCKVGFNVKPLEVLIISFPERHTVQSVGRVMRICDELPKKIPIVYDFVHTCFKDQARERRGWYYKNGLVEDKKVLEWHTSLEI